MNEKTKKISESKLDLYFFTASKLDPIQDHQNKERLMTMDWVPLKKTNLKMIIVFVFLLHYLSDPHQKLITLDELLKGDSF